MKDKQLRAKLIRLAHANPPLRKDLLPLLTKRAADSMVAIPTDGSLYVYQKVAMQQYFFECCLEFERKLKTSKEISGPFKTRFSDDMYSCSGKFLDTTWHVSFESKAKPSDASMALTGFYSTEKGGSLPAAGGHFGSLNWFGPPSKSGAEAAIQFLNILVKMKGK